MGIGNRTNSDIDDRTERECVARGLRAALNKGNISPRWVDVMPQVTGPSMLDEARIASRLAKVRAEESAPTPEPPQMAERTDAERAYHAEVSRRAWERKRMRMYGGKTREQLAEEREEKRRLTRTPEQQRRHDDYIARKARKEEVTE